jgi:hypothetical protein
LITRGEVLADRYVGRAVRTEATTQRRERDPNGGVEISAAECNRILLPDREKDRMTTIRKLSLVAALVPLPIAARAEATLEETSKASVGDQKFTYTPLGAKKK